MIGSRVLHLSRPALGALVLVGGLGNTGFLGLPFQTALFGRDVLTDAVAYDVMVSGATLVILGFMVGAAFGTVADRKRDRLRSFVTRNPPLWAVAAGLVAPEALAPEILVDGSQLLVLAVVPFGFFAVGVTLAGSGVRGLPPLDGPTADCDRLQAGGGAARWCSSCTRRSSTCPTSTSSSPRWRARSTRSWWPTSTAWTGGCAPEPSPGPPCWCSPWAWSSRSCSLARAMPPSERPVPMYAAEPPQEPLPYGRWAETLLGHFRDACEVEDSEEQMADGAEPTWFPDRTWGGRTYLPLTVPAAGGGELFGYVSWRRDHEGAQAADFKAAANFTEDTASENPDWQLDLSDEEIGHWRASEGRRGTVTLVWGVAMVPNGVVATAELGPDHHRPVRVDLRPLHAGLTRPLHRRLRGGPAVRAQGRRARDRAAVRGRLGLRPVRRRWSWRRPERRSGAGC